MPGYGIFGVIGCFVGSLRSGEPVVERSSIVLVRIVVLSLYEDKEVLNGFTS